MSTKYGYRKAGYSKAFLETHREEITLHKAAKASFDEARLQKLPKVKELDAEFAELLTKKKAAYPDYRKARNEMQELVWAQKNIELFLQRKRTPPRKYRHVKKVAEELPCWEASSADFLVYTAALRRSVTRIFSPRSFHIAGTTVYTDSRTVEKYREQLA